MRPVVAGLFLAGCQVPEPTGSLGVCVRSEALADEPLNNRVVTASLKEEAPFPLANCPGQALGLVDETGQEWILSWSLEIGGMIQRLQPPEPSGLLTLVFYVEDEAELEAGERGLPAERLSVVVRDPEDRLVLALSTGGLPQTSAHPEVTVGVGQKLKGPDFSMTFDGEAFVVLEPGLAGPVPAAEQQLTAYAISARARAGEVEAGPERLVYALVGPPPPEP